MNWTEISLMSDDEEILAREAEILDAIEEAEMLESAFDQPSHDHVMKTASRLAGVSLVDIELAYINRPRIYK